MCAWERHLTGIRISKRMCFEMEPDIGRGLDQIIGYVEWGI